MRPGLSGSEKAEIIRAAQRQVFERDIAKAYSQEPCSVEASQVRQGQISMREFIRALGKSKEYRTQFFGRFSNSRAVELAFRHFLGRGPSSLEEFRKYFAIVSAQGLGGLVDSLINSMEYARVFGEETVPYLRDLGEEAQESAGWGSNRKLFQFSAPFEGAPQYVTLYAAYRQPLADQHVYGGGNDPIGLQYGAIFPSATASVATRPAPMATAPGGFWWVMAWKAQAKWIALDLDHPNRGGWAPKWCGCNKSPPVAAQNQSVVVQPISATQNQAPKQLSMLFMCRSLAIAATPVIESAQRKINLKMATLACGNSSEWWRAPRLSAAVIGVVYISLKPLK